MRAERLETIAQAVVEQTLHELPAPIREAAADCLIELVFMEDCHAVEEELETDLLGLFEGCSRADPEPESAGQLPRIRLFLDNLWDYVEADIASFRQEVRITLLHELGHYLGLDEDQVEALGLA